MTTVILVPYRSDGARRDQLWQYVRRHLTKHHPDWPIHIGQSPDGPFNRSAAINHAADCEWDTAVITDADTFVPPTQLTHAVNLAGERLVAAFDHVVELTRNVTERHLTGARNIIYAGNVRTEPLTIQSSVLAISRTLWDKVGGFDEGFVGWAAEDNAFWRACTIHGGEPLRVEGPAYHLWHRSARPSWRDENYQNNQKRWQQYLTAETPADLEQFTAVTIE